MEGQRGRGAEARQFKATRKRCRGSRGKSCVVLSLAGEKIYRLKD